MATKKKSSSRAKPITLRGMVNKKFWNRLSKDFPLWDAEKYFLAVGKGNGRGAIDKEYWLTESHSIPIEPKQTKEYDIVDPDKLVTRKNFVTIRYTYPLGADVDFTFKHKGGFTRKQLFRAIQRGYLKIYREQASGKRDYGIWGHSIGDLVLERVRMNGRGRVFLGIGS